MSEGTRRSEMAAAAWAQLGAAIGPVVPWAIWLSQRRRSVWAARQAAAATNFGMLVLVVFVAASLVRVFVPLVGFVGTLAQLAVVVVSLSLGIQGFRAVRGGLPATYPYDIKVVRRHD
ncbi:DUF4870 domain-containing protein [Demequina sp. NBRC 110055]|uniref:DUF4870 domain-containing protein n=1 Tax=Demequina sp. NBRC 110055 TaxID=1570344 RepID=UPI000A064569|nr:DUF4870 domain-containing protein [Demequina sp. NBRC 110055]